MIITLDWLKTYLPDLTLSAEVVAEQLTLIGHETELTAEGTLDVAITPNRGDCLSIYGLARDLAATQGLSLDPLAKPDLPASQNWLSLKVTDAGQPFVEADALLLIENYRSQPSPKDIQAKLQLLGLQPKDLLIDLTNALAYELGLPLHVFDADLLPDGLTFDVSKDHETISLLDGQTLVLPTGTLIQRSGADIVDLVGIKGGAVAKVSDQTTRVIVQAGSFAPAQINQTARQLGLRTSAAGQYGRGVDPAAGPTVLTQFWRLVQQAAPATTIGGYYYLSSSQPPTTITLEPDRINALLGLDLVEDDFRQLEKLGLRLEAGQVIVPSWRRDLTTNADLAEELLRLRGFRELSGQALPATAAISEPADQKLQLIRQHLLLAGFTETMTYSFATDGPLKLRNPRTSEQAAMRPSLVEGLLQTAAKNPFLKKALLYEIGDVFSPDEKTHLGLLVVGYQTSDHLAPLTTALGAELAWQPVSNEVRSRAGLRQTAWLAELPIDRLKPTSVPLPAPAPLGQYKKISKFPSVSRDVTLLVTETVAPETILAFFRSQPDIIVADWTDSFVSPEKLGLGKRADTFRLLFQDLNQSLTDQAASNLLEGHFQELRKTVEFELR